MTGPWGRRVMWACLVGALAWTGATNIEICDDGLAERARKRKAYKVNHFLGQAMIPMYRQHFACFWDEQALELFVACLRGDEAALQAFDGLNVSISTMP